MDLSFAVHKLETFSANPLKVHFEALVHMLSYIRGNKTLGLKYYVNINDTPVSDLLRQASIKLRTNWWLFLIIVGNIFQKLAEVHDHTLYVIKVGQLTMAHIFQDQLLNQVQKVSTIQHAMQEWL